MKSGILAGKLPPARNKELESHLNRYEFQAPENENNPKESELNSLLFVWPEYCKDR